jgi:opacity protein-like surface antigen
MKKLIVLSVVFALLASVAFAADVSGAVFGTVDVLQSSTEDEAKVTSGGVMGRIRLEASGESDEGDFGGWIRVEPTQFAGYDVEKLAKAEAEAGDGEEIDPANYVLFSGIQGYVWWKPVDQLKLLIGGNSDGLFGKDGITRWGFYGLAGDVGVATEGWSFGASFFEGWGDKGLLLTITPVEIVEINIAIPFLGFKADEDGKTTAAAFKQTTAQVAANLDFGTIAVTYKGALMEGADQPKIFAYYGGTFGAISLDFGVGYGMPLETVDPADDTKTISAAQPINVGLGVKYAADTLGVKARVQGSLAGEDKSTVILADILPYFMLSDNLTAFVSVGLGMTMPDGGDTVVGWHFNPYLQIGSEGGPAFLAGVDVRSPGGEEAKIYWKVPIALAISF